MGAMPAVRRQVESTAVALAVAVVVAASGCGTAGTERASAPLTLVVAQGNDPGSFNPAITTSGNVHPVTDQIFNGLVGLDETMAPVPELAERWDVTEGGRTYTFHLRRGVTWHDGRPFTSADVTFTFDQVLLKFHSRTRAALGNVLVGIDAPGPHTVVFRFREPYAPLLQRLDVVEASILPRHLFDGTDVLSAAANLQPVGTGPFRFVTYRKGDYVELARNRHYFRPGVPAIERLVFRITPSTTTAVMALERGEIDSLPSVPGSELPRLRADAALTVVKASGGSGGSFCQDVVIPNLTRPPLGDVRVRRAIYQALDRQLIAERVYFGQGTPSTGPISRQLRWAYSPEVRRYPHDPGEAARMLDEAGYRHSGREPRLRLTFTHPTASARLGQALRDQLKQVGIELRLESLDFNASVEKTFVRKDFDLGFASYCNGADPEIGVRRVYASDNIGPIPFSNGAGYRSAAADQLFQQAATTLDRQARARLYAALQQVLADDLPYFWIIDSDSARAYRRRFTGFRVWSGAFAETVAEAGRP
jgi:peptide/nickel transport system substrate-binding protein